MSKQKSLKLNFVMNSILTMSQFIFPLITFPYVSRILLPAGTGKVSFATSIVSYFTLFAQLGIPTYGIRACAKVRDDREELSKMVQELLIINLVMSALSYAVYFAAIYYVPRFRQDKELFLIIGLTIFFNAIGMEWLYKALEQYTYITVRSIIFKFIAIVAMFLMVHEQSDYVIYGGISILASSASNIFNFFHIHRYINIKPVGHYNFKKHLKAIVVFFGGYTKMIANLLDEIEVRLSTDYLENKAELDALADKVVYTGPIDAYFDYKLGTLEYRSVRFEAETLDKPNFQGNAAVNYTDRETPWTRIIEHKWFEFGKDENGNDLPKTIISREYSSEWKPGDEPYYPVNDAKNDLP